MTQTTSDLPAADLSTSNRYFALVSLLFVGSGCAALIYEIVWFQLLSLVVGSSAISLAVILGTYMGGMCLGSLAFTRVVPRRLHPLGVYAAIEVGIAALAGLILVALPYAGGLYVAVGGGGARGLVARAVVAALCLLPPTTLMGATLPAVGRWVEASPRGVARLGDGSTGRTRRARCSGACSRGTTSCASTTWPMRRAWPPP